MSEWIVLTVSDSRRNTAIVEPLNPLIKKKKDVPYLIDQHLLEKKNA